MTSSGSPVITTKGTESGLLVERTHTGIAIDYNVDAAAEAIINLLKEKAFYKKCFDNAISTSKEYDWERFMQKYYSLIKQRYESFA